jgi:hypothetical protein
MVNRCTAARTDALRIITSAHNKTLLALLVVLPILSALTVTSHAATSNTPTYVLGVSSPTDPLIIDLQSLTSSVTILPGISSLGLVGGNSILFVDGQWLQTASSLDPTLLSLVASKALNAIPTIVIRGSPSLLADSISGLLKTRALGLPLISDGVQIFGTLPDGTRQAMVLQVIAGFDYAVQAEFNWAQQLLLHPSTTALVPLASTLTSPASGTTHGTSKAISATTTSTGSSFTLIGKFVTSTGDQDKPFGRFSYNFTIFRLQNSGSSTSKWYNFFFNETLQPGISIYNNISNWRTAQELDHINVTNQASNLFVNHGPQTFGTIGPSSVTYTIGVTNGTLGAQTTANQTQSYPLKNTQVTDLSQNGFNVGWEHDINSRTDAGKLTFSIIPGWTDRVTSDGQIAINSSFTSRFNSITGGNVQTQPIQTTIAVFGG